MVDEEITKTIMQDITLLKYVGVNPVVVHGGGPKISETLNLMNIESQFHKGLRITTEDAIDVVEMVLAGSINKEIVSQLNSLGGKAIGICGKDGNLIQVEKKVSIDNVDLGYVGEIKKVDSKIIEVLARDEYIPVIAPIGTDDKGQSYNINADTAAGEIAAALKAEKLIFLTDIDGIYLDPKDPESLISVISVPEIYEIMDKGIITGHDTQGPGLYQGYPARRKQDSYTERHHPPPHTAGDIHP